MAGLVPAIHVFTCSQAVDARHKAGHDEIRISPGEMEARYAAIRPASQPSIARLRVMPQ